MQIPDDVRNDLVEMQPGKLKTRNEFVQELIEATHLSPDGGRVSRTKTSVAVAILWEAHPDDGATNDGQRARAELGWKSDRRYNLEGLGTAND